jgi:hypothetical protein
MPRRLTLSPEEHMLSLRVRDMDGKLSRGLGGYQNLFSSAVEKREDLKVIFRSRSVSESGIKPEHFSN